MADWWDDPAFGSGQQAQQPDWADDPAFSNGKKSPVTKGDVANQQASDLGDSHWGHLVDMVSGAVSHVVPDTVGFLGDLAHTAMKEFPLNPAAAGTLTRQDIPGQGPVSQKAEEVHNRVYGPDVQPNGAAERYLYAGSRGVADMVPFALGAPGPALLSGLGQGVGGQAASDLFPGSAIAPLIGSVVGGGLGVVPHVAGAIRTGSLIRAGMAHPDYQALIDSAILPNEGGGTLEHPKTNPTSGAEGVMQVMPATARDPGYGIRPWDGKSQADLARVGRQKFAVLLGKYDDPEKALAAYDWGEGNLNKAVSKYGDAWYDHAPDETQKYVAKGMTRVYGGPLPHESAELTDIPSPSNVIDLNKARQADITKKLYEHLTGSKAPDDLSMEDMLGAAKDSFSEGGQNLTPSEMQEMDASADKPQVVTTADEAHVPSEGPPPAANDPGIDPEIHRQAFDQAVQDYAEANHMDPEEVERVYDQLPEGHPMAGVIEQRKAELLAEAPPRQPPVGGDGTGGGEPPVPPSGGEPPASDPVTKLRGILGQMDELRKDQDAQIQQIRKQRYSEAGTRLNAFSGEAGANATMSALKGKLPETEINSFRKRFSQEDLDQLFNQVQNHPAIDFQTKLRATTGLQKLVSPVGNRLPTRSELDALGLVFPKDVVDGLKKHSSLGEIIANTLSIPRALMASADFSAPLRQGVFMIGRKEFYGAAKGMFKKAFSQSDFDAMQQEIASRPTYGMMQEGGLSLTAISHDITKREEMFMSNYAEKIPGIGHVVKGSDRAYVAFLNKVRADVFDNLVHRYEELHGESISNNPKALRDLSGYINAATGRGSLGKFTQSAPFLSAGLFAPRLIASRLTLLNPLYYARLDPFVRREALTDLFKFAGTAMTVLTLAHMAGFSVGWDPRSVDFGKIRIKDTRFDILGGFGQYIRTFAQIITSQSKNPDTGKVTNLVGGLGLHVTKGEDQGPYKPTTAFDEATRLVVNKAAPVPGMALDMLRGGNAVGQPLDWSLKDKQTGVNFNNPIVQRVTPLVIQDTMDALKEYKATSGIPYAVAGTGLLGVGTQTYQPVQHAKKAKSSDDWSNDKAFDNFGSFGSKKDGF